MSDKEQCKVARETAASEVMNELECVVKRAEAVFTLVAERTSSVTTAETPTEKKAEKITRNYPPLFTRIRGLLDSIHASLSGIEDIMRRCEL